MAIASSDAPQPDRRQRKDIHIQKTVQSENTDTIIISFLKLITNTTPELTTEYPGQASSSPCSFAQLSHSSALCLEHYIPLSKRKIPKRPPVELPPPPKAYKLGTKSADLEALEASALDTEEEFRLKCLIDRDKWETEGQSDQLSEMQEVTWPLKRIKKGNFKTEMCFDMIEDGQPVLLWCTGVITKILKDRAEKDKYILAEVHWDKECVQPGEDDITVEKLSRNCWNAEKHGMGSWRENLRHLKKNVKSKY